jgi:hypothetical protein
MAKGMLWPHECVEVRQRVRRSEAVFDELAEEYRVGYRTIRRHVCGLCTCSHDVAPVPM